MGTKNNLAIGHGECSHTKLSSAYVIGDDPYNLNQMVEGAASWKEYKPDDWNSLKMDEKLKAVEEYIAAVSARPSDEFSESASTTPGDVAPDPASVEPTVKKGTEDAGDGDDEKAYLKARVEQLEAMRDENGKSIARLEAAVKEGGDVEALVRERDTWRSKAAELKGLVDLLEQDRRRSATLHGHTDDLKTPY